MEQRARDPFGYRAEFLRLVDLAKVCRRGRASPQRPRGVVARLEWSPGSRLAWNLAALLLLKLLFADDPLALFDYD